MMIFFTLLIVGARIYTQIRVTRQFGLSDYLMICSAFVLTGFASLISVQYHFGWGRHQSCRSSPALLPYARSRWQFCQYFANEKVCTV